MFVLKLSGIQTFVNKNHQFFKIWSNKLVNLFAGFCPTLLKAVKGLDTGPNLGI